VKIDVRGKTIDEVIELSLDFMAQCREDAERKCMSSLLALPTRCAGVAFSCVISARRSAT
jgi:hypothetical protein